MVRGVRLVVLKPNRSELYSPYRHLSTNKLLDWGRSYCRSSHQTCSLKKCVLRNFTKFTGKHLCQWIFVNFAKFLRTHFLQNTSAQLHLILIPPSSSSFMTKFPIIQKSVHGFAEQINGPVYSSLGPPSWKS